MKKPDWVSWPVAIVWTVAAVAITVLGIVSSAVKP